MHSRHQEQYQACMCKATVQGIKTKKVPEQMPNELIIIAESIQKLLAHICINWNATAQTIPLS